MRVVIDTNLLVSSVIAQGTPRQLLQAARAGRFEWCTSNHLLAELQRVLGSAKFASRLTRAELNLETFMADLRRLATVVAPAQVPRIVPSDPDDDHVLAAAVAAGADLIVTGDSDLLPLGNHMGIAIVTARQALQRIAD